jgi:hypothetical protein
MASRDFLERCLALRDGGHVRLELLGHLLADDPVGELLGGLDDRHRERRRTRRVSLDVSSIVKFL